MNEPEIVTMRDGREYRRMPNGSLERVSIVKLNAKQRKKLYAKMRAAVAAAPAPQDLTRLTEDVQWVPGEYTGIKREEFSSMDERKKFLADIEKEW